MVKGRENKGNDTGDTTNDTPIMSDSIANNSPNDTPINLPKRRQTGKVKDNEGQLDMFNNNFKKQITKVLESNNNISNKTKNSINNILGNRNKEANNNNIKKIILFRR